LGQPDTHLLFKKSHGSLTGTGVGTGNEIQNLSRLRLVLRCLRARLRIHFELPVRFESLGWEKRSLSGSSPVLHGQELRHCRDFACVLLPHPAKKLRFAPAKQEFANLFCFIISSLCFVCVTGDSSFDSIYGAYHHNAIAGPGRRQSKPQVCALHCRLLTPVTGA
jgi:hypothetical protein